MADDRVVCSYPGDIPMSNDLITRLMDDHGVSFPEAVELASEMSLCRCCGRTGPVCICTYGPAFSGTAAMNNHDRAIGTVELVEKWLLREMIEDGQATPEIKLFLQDFAKRRDLDLTRN